MAQYQIPNEFKKGFDEIIGFSAEDFDKLLTLLKSLSPGIRHKTIHKEIESFLGHPVSASLVSVLFSFGNLLYHKEDSIDDISQNLAASYGEIFKVDDDKLIDNLTKRLFAVLSEAELLKITYKATTLLSANDKIYLSSKIISDIRLIFNDDLNDSKRNAVIIHQLKVKHQTNGEEQDLYLSLDTNDLLQLKNQLLRAIDKEAAIKNEYGQFINFLTISE